MNRLIQILRDQAARHRIENVITLGTDELHVVVSPLADIDEVKALVEEIVFLLGENGESYHINYLRTSF